MSENSTLLLSIASSPEFELWKSPQQTRSQASGVKHGAHATSWGTYLFENRALVNAFATPLDQKEQHNDEKHASNHPNNSCIVQVTPPFFSG